MHTDKSCLNQAMELILYKFGNAVIESEWSGVTFYVLQFSEFYSNEIIRHPSIGKIKSITLSTKPLQLHTSFFLYATSSTLIFLDKLPS